MTKGIAKGYYLDVLRRMRNLGYQADARLLDAQYLGVPQRRTRVIFIGMRNDLQIAPRFPTPLPYAYSVREALPWLDAATYDPHGQFPTEEFIDKPSPAIIGSGTMAGRNAHHYLVQDAGVYGHQFRPADEPAPTIMATGKRAVLLVQEGAAPGKWRSASDPAPPIMSGRVASLEVQDGANQRQYHSIDEPAPCILSANKHKNYLRGQAPPMMEVQDGAVQDRWHDATGPAPPILGGGSSGPGHRQALRSGTYRRKFTLIELKRLCAFPEDFAMSGTYAEQWARFGNSVPPLMAAAIATCVRDVLAEVDGRVPVSARRRR
jgi:DNA (cytosine-5)-methyltransferase 1